MKYVCTVEAQGAPHGEVIDSGFFFATVQLQGDASKLAEEIAFIMRVNNGYPAHDRPAFLAPTQWDVDGTSIMFSLIGNIDCIIEEWRDEDERWAQHACTTYATEQYLASIFGLDFEVHPLVLANRDHIHLIDSLRYYRHGWHNYTYPSVEDVIAAGHQEKSLIGTQGEYAATSPYFSAVLRTREATESLRVDALSAACKVMARTAGVCVAPQVAFQLEDGRYELRIVGCCTRESSRINRRTGEWQRCGIAATDSVRDPLGHYLGVTVEELHIFKTDAEHYEDIIAAEKAGDEFELMGLPEPEDFIIKPREEVLADDARKASGLLSELLEPELTGEQELDALIGLEDTKRQIREIIAYAKAQKERGGRMPRLHMAFRGNPGTGKTTIARIIGHMLYDAGLLPKRNVFVETSGADFSSEHIQQARRGVLFIDEAYALASRWPGTLAHLVKAMEDCYQNFERDGFICIMAGYPHQMDSMIAVNPGMRDRIGVYIDFEDYTTSELIAVFNKLAASDGYMLDDDAQELIEKRLRQVENNKDANFANARLVQRIYDRMLICQSTAHGSSSQIGTDVINRVFESEFADLIGGRRGSEHKKEQRNKLTGDEQLEELIGLEHTKQQIRDFLDYAAVQKRRGGVMPSLHMCFKGNPGTGKTTFARIIGRMMYDRGLLPKSDSFVECGREDLVGPFVGSTAPKTKQKIQEARHGVLFVDEAYALDGGSQHDFGKEALAVLVKEMEDSLDTFERDGFVCIMAGYPKLMDQMISLNPGLRDRFGLTVNFDDYDADELLQVFELYAKREKYRLTKGARAALEQHLHELVASKDEDFGNARLVRKVFERAKVYQSLAYDTNSWFKPDVIERVFSDEDLSTLVSSKHVSVGFAA